MKATELKKLIKEAVREAIQDELKEILLEAVKAPRVTQSPINESKSTPVIPPTPTLSSVEKKQKYMDIIGETALNFTSKDVQKFNPQGASIDTTSPNGQLPNGEVGMDQIMNLMTP